MCSPAVLCCAVLRCPASRLQWHLAPGHKGAGGICVFHDELAAQRAHQEVRALCTRPPQPVCGCCSWPAGQLPVCQLPLALIATLPLIHLTRATFKQYIWCCRCPAGCASTTASSTCCTRCYTTCKPTSRGWAWWPSARATPSGKFEWKACLRLLAAAGDCWRLLAAAGGCWRLLAAAGCWLLLCMCRM